MILKKIRPEVIQSVEYKVWLFIETLINDIIVNIPDFEDFKCSRQTEINLSNLNGGIISYHLSNSNRIYNRNFLTDSFQVDVRFYITLKDDYLNKDKIYKLTNLLINLLTDNWNSSNSISNTYNSTVDSTELKTDLTLNEVIDEPFIKMIKQENILNHITSTFTIKFKIFK